MDTQAREALERVARNLPVKGLDFCRIPTDWGLVHIAIGRGYSTEPKMGVISWQGVYAITYGRNAMARMGEVSGNASKNEALQHFLGDAVWMYRLFDERDMLDESYTLDARRTP